ncbi:hypothetical protein ACFL3T_02490 [Patescibacteria group bacterium]
MPPRIGMKDLRECKTFLKNPDTETPKILQTLEIREIRLLLQAAAESIILDDNPDEMRALQGMLVLINDKYPLNKHEESPTRCKETFRKGAPEQWQQVLDNRSRNRTVFIQPDSKK